MQIYYMYYCIAVAAASVVVSILVECCGRRLVFCFLCQAIMLGGLIWNKLEEPCDQKIRDDCENNL